MVLFVRLWEDMMKMPRNYIGIAPFLNVLKTTEL